MLERRHARFPEAPADGRPVSTLRCAMCRADLVATRQGDTEAWVCPTGHGVALVASSAPTVAAALAGVWARADAAAPGIRHCPRCDGEMAVVSAGQDPVVKADACVRCEVLWLDALEIAGLAPTPLEDEDLVARAVSLLRSDEMQPAL
jgi:Zn-finger nucleic acid-binding protein